MRNNKTLRSLLAAALAIVMAMALAIPAFALEIPSDRPDLAVIAGLYADWDGSYELPDLSELSENDQEIVKAMVDAIMVSREAENTQAKIQDEIPLTISFTDVSSSHTFYRGIIYCAGKGIVNGYPDKTFRPATTVAKSHFTAMLARAFYADHVAKYDTEQCKQTYGTFGPTNLALAANGTLNNTSFRWKYANASVMSTGINRYDMAQMMTNIMTAKGFSASSSQKNAIQSKITDYANIPSQYQDAVKNVYALGIITGYKDGSFVGNNIMNRGQAAIVIQRMAQYAPVKGDQDNDTYDDGTEQKPNAGNSSNTGNSGSSNTGTTPPETKPETPANKPTTVAVTTSRDSSGDTRWKITNNGYSTGTLNNGKPITQANVLAMLAEAKKIWPDGLTWADMGDAKNNNFYGHGGTDKAIAAKCVRSYNTNEAYACGGFAAMLSDYVFGPSSNPVRKLSDNLQVRPGDIVFYINPNGSIAHVNIAMTTVGTTNGGNPGIKTANGNTGGVIDWRDTATNYTDRIDDYQRAAGMSTCVIYTRYPD